jgi:ribA/ribD-fused uncharacterized protein
MKQIRPGQYIDFYNQHEDFYEFTNFYPVELTIEGKTYPTSEHYFQAAKFLHTAPQVAEMIRLAPRPRGAFDIAHQYYQQERSDWMQVREQVMGYVLSVKFQNPYLREVLLLTGNYPLREHTVNDKYWGDGGDGSGQNRLGQLLEQTRAQLQQQSGQPKQASPTPLTKQEPASQPRAQLQLSEPSARQPPTSGAPRGTNLPQQPWHQQQSTAGGSVLQPPSMSYPQLEQQQPQLNALAARESLPAAEHASACLPTDEPEQPPIDPGYLCGKPQQQHRAGDRQKSGLVLEEDGQLPWQEARDASQFSPQPRSSDPQVAQQPRFASTRSGGAHDADPALATFAVPFASQASQKPILQSRAGDDATLLQPKHPRDGDDVSRPLPAGAMPTPSQRPPEVAPIGTGSKADLIFACEATLAALSELKTTLGAAYLGTECSRYMMFVRDVLDNPLNEIMILERLRTLFEKTSDDALRHISNSAVLQYELASHRIVLPFDVTQCRFKSTVHKIGLVETQQMWTLKVGAIVRAMKSTSVTFDSTASEILRVGGPALRLEMAQYATTQPGEMFATTGGGLPCDHVIHLVAPHASQVSSQEDANRMLIDCLDCCGKLGATSVAVPHLAPQFPSLNENSCTMRMLWAVQDFLAVKRATGVQMAVYFVAGDSKAAQIFRDAGL